MKILFLFINFIFLIFSSHFALASKSAIPDNISVEINYRDSMPNQFGQMNQTHLKNVIKFSTDPKAWTLIAGTIVQPNPASTAESFILLGKIEEANADTVKIKLLPVTINMKNPLNMEQTIIAPYSKRKQIAFKNAGKSVQIEVLASKE